MLIVMNFIEFACSDDKQGRDYASCSGSFVRALTFQGYIAVDST